MEGQGKTPRFSSQGIDDILIRYSFAKTGRSTWESNWQELAEYIIPERANITTTSVPGDKKMSKIIDTTALDALELWASGLNGLMTNDALDWFALKMEDDNLNGIQEISIWLEDTARRMHAAIRASNFQMEIYEVYLDAGSLGTTSLYITEGVKTDLQFQARHINEICVIENSDGFVDTLFREFDLTARQVAQQFGEDALTEAMRKANSEKKEDQKFAILHYIYPRSDEKREKDGNGEFKEHAKSLPFASVYIAKEEKKVISEGGYHEFPYAVPRTKKMTGEIYGRSPAWNALPDIKMVNAMCKTYLRTVQKMADPPVSMPDEGYVMPVKLGPGGINYRSTVGGSGADNNDIKVIGSGSQPEFADKEIESRRKSIKDKFFYDLWILPEQPNMTATEVLERIQQKLRIIGPFLGRFQYELLKPIVQRVFGIMYRAGKLLDAPAQVIQSGGVDVVFTSPISDAQQAYQAEALNKTLMMAAPVFQADPSTMDNVDGDAVVRFYWDAMRAPMSLLRTVKARNGIRNARAQAQANQQRMQEAMAMTEGAKNLKGTGIMEEITRGIADQTGTTEGMLQ